MPDNEPSDRAKRLKRLLEEAGIVPAYFEYVEELEPQYDDFTKLKVQSNGLLVKSFELYTHARKPETLRIHYAPAAPEWFKGALADIPFAEPSPRVGVNFSGSLPHAAKAISEILSRNAERWQT